MSDLSSSTLHRAPGLSRRQMWRAARYTLLIIIAVIYLTPLVLALVSSFKSPQGLQNILSLPTEFYTRNYTDAWDRMGRSVLNSFMITIPAVFLSVVVGSMAAFPLSHAKIPGQRFIFLFLLMGMLVPYQSVQIPLFMLMRWLGLYNTIPGLWLVHMAYGVPFCVFFMRNFFMTVPRSMYEAARIDGCGPAGYFFKILLPASMPGIAALAIVQSRAVWNDLFFGLTITSSPSVSPAPVALYSMIGGLEVDEGPVMAATIISILPMLVAFLIFQKAFTRGLLGGSSK